MKHKRLTALVLAAALVLAGCGGTKSRMPRRLPFKRNVSWSNSRWKKPSGTSTASPRS